MRTSKWEWVHFPFHRALCMCVYIVYYAQHCAVLNERCECVTKRFTNKRHMLVYLNSTAQLGSHAHCVFECAWLFGWKCVDQMLILVNNNGARTIRFLLCSCLSFTFLSWNQCWQICLLALWTTTYLYIATMRMFLKCSFQYAHLFYENK